MKNAIYRSLDDNGVTNITSDELKGGIIGEMTDILLLPSNEVVKGDHLMSLTEEPVAKM
jgi:hypothetical protein